MLSKLKNIESVLYECEKYRKNPNEISNPEMKSQMNFKMGNTLREHKEALDGYKKY